MLVQFIFLLITICITDAGLTAKTRAPDFSDDSWMHPHRSSKTASNQRSIEAVDTASYWQDKAQSLLEEKLGKTLNKNKAKNVILFLGDGLSIPTIKAARIYMGQINGQSAQEQEEGQLSFEKFPYVGLSKTYCTDVLVADSACTATAYLCGIKAREATIGVTGSVYLGDCEASQLEENHVSSIAEWSQLKNKKTGLVTTTRVTHASPAGVYAHIADRDWEYNTNGTGCEDIAYQLVNREPGKNLNVIMGGGRRNFLDDTVEGEEGDKGYRSDGENLIQSWLEDKKAKDGKYVWNKQQLLDLDEDTEYVLGLFESSHMKYHLENDEDEPTLEEMVEAAIKILDNDEGFFLFVEGGRIDHAHHDTWTKKALDETVEFSKAIQKARDLTSEEDTLIVVTSDHAHVMSVSGYPPIGADILGQSGIADDGYPHSILSYANGPGYKENVDDHRYDTTDDDTHDDDYQFPTLAYMESETHGGDEVGIFASGPWAHLFTGVIEQNAIPHLMAYASCVGDGLTSCDTKLEEIQGVVVGPSRTQRWGWYCRE